MHAYYRRFSSINTIDLAVVMVIVVTVVDVIITIRLSGCLKPSRSEGLK